MVEAVKTFQRQARKKVTGKGKATTQETESDENIVEEARDEAESDLTDVK